MAALKAKASCEAFEAATVASYEALANAIAADKAKAKTAYAA